MTRLRTLTVIALSVALIPTGAAIAQSSDGFGAGGQDAAPAESGSKAVIDIDFGGGNLAEYYEHLQDRTGVRNIILKGEGLAGASMPEVKLSSVLFGDAVELPYFLAEVPEDRNLDIETVGSSRTIFVIGLASRSEPMMSAPEYRLISFEFPGGSLEDFVATVQRTAGTQKVLVRGNAAEFEMPPLILEGVSLRGVLSALNGDERRSESGVRSRVLVDERNGVYLVEVLTERQGQQSQADLQIRTVSWSLASLRGPDRLSTEEMLTAIEAAVEVGGNADTTAIRFHDETSLLIVSAQPATLETIDGVLRELRRSSDEAFAEHQRLMEQHAEMDSMRANEVRLVQTIQRIEQQIEQINSGDNSNRKAMIHLVEEELRKHQGQLDQLLYEMQAFEDRIRTQRGS